MVYPEGGPGVVQLSMSRKATSGDNAAMEGFFGTVKQELLYGRPEMASLTRAELTRHLEDYLAWYIHVRPAASLGYQTPAEHREELLAA